MPPTDDGEFGYIFATVTHESPSATSMPSSAASGPSVEPGLPDTGDPIELENDAAAAAAADGGLIFSGDVLFLGDTA